MSADDLPETWRSLKLGDIVDYGNTDKVEPTQISQDSWVLELEDIEKDTSKLLQRITYKQRLSKSTKNRFNRGDVLYGKLRPYLNKVIIAPESGYCSTEIIPLKSPQGIDERYLFYWLKHPHFLSYVDSVSHGINMPRLGTEAGKNAPFVLAPFNEQKRIADKLDVLLGHVHVCRARLEAMLELMSRFEQSALMALSSGAFSYSSTEWHSVQLAGLADVVAGTAFPSEYFKKMGECQVVKIANVKDGYINLAAAPAYIEKDIASQYDNVRTRENDILISMTGTKYKRDYGFVGMVGKETLPLYVNQRVSIVRPKTDRVLPEFLFLYMRSERFRMRFLQGETGGVNQGNVGTTHLRSCLINFPGIPEQERVVAKAKKLLLMHEFIEARLDESTIILKQLATASVERAFRGELVPQDPNDEPARTLLARLTEGQSDRGTHQPKRNPKVKQGKKSSETRKSILEVINGGDHAGMEPQQVLSAAGYTLDEVEQFYVNLAIEVNGGRVQEIRREDGRVLLVGV
jgi:type I restriction enzyme S subunit